jgi:hypothetical protein
MAGTIQAIHPRRTGGQEFVDAFSPYLQQAFQMMLQQKMQEQQTQRNLQLMADMGLAERIQPEEAQITSEAGFTPKYPQMLPPAERQAFYQDVYKMKYGKPGTEMVEAPGPVAQYANQEGNIPALGMVAPSIPKQYQNVIKPKLGIEGLKLTFGESGIPVFGYEAPDAFTQAYKQSQLELNKEIVDRMKNIKKSDIRYRSNITGEEVDAETAMADIAQGNTNKYIITKVMPTKYGEQETPLIKPEDLTQEEKNYIITSQRIQTRLKGILDFSKNERFKSYGGWQGFQAEKLPFWMINDKDVQDIKSNISAVKGDIPFLRGGKQLTPTEAKRVDILLNPFGKSDEIYTRDIQQFLDEFVTGEQVMLKGVKAFFQGQQPMQQTNYSNQRIDPLEGRTAINPQTQQRIIRRGGQWILKE